LTSLTYGYDGLVLDSLLPKLTPKNMLPLKVVKSDPKTIISHGVFYYIESKSHMSSISSKFYAHFFVQNFGTENHKAKHNSRKAAEKLPKRLPYEKREGKTLMKLSPGRL